VTAVTVETRDKNNRRRKHEDTYTLEEFPAHDEGCFGFRMVGSHHQYKNLNIHELRPKGAGKRDQALGDDSALPLSLI